MGNIISSKRKREEDSPPRPPSPPVNPHIARNERRARNALLRNSLNHPAPLPNQHQLHNHVSNNVETASLASVNVNIPDPVLPPTKSITVQTDEVDLNLITKSDPLRISTEPLNGEGAELSLSTSFDSMDDTKSKSTDVSMEDALACSIKDADPDCDEEIEDLPTPPATPPAEERLKSPVSTTSRSPPSPTHAMTPTRKV